MNGRILLSLLLWLVFVVDASGQINCTNSNKLVCQVPFATGGSTPGATKQAQDLAKAFNAPIAAQLSQLPLASSSSGIVTGMIGGVPTSLENLGPILSDSPQTIGKNRIFVGFAFQQYNFNAIDGISMSAVPFVTQSQTVPGDPTSQTQWIQQVEHISFKYDQYVAVVTAGLTSKTDLSVIVPVNRVSIGVGNVGLQTQYFYSALPENQFIFKTTFPASYTKGIASGIGDMLFNVKQVFWAGSSERATFSGGFLLRAPTGNAVNYLGSGAWGFNPYGLFSYQWLISPHLLISPHARLGYQWNTSSVLVNPTGGNQALPGGLQFGVGADTVVYKSVTVALDFLGNQFLNSPTLVNTTVAGSRAYTDVPNDNVNPPISIKSLPTVATVNSSYTVGYFSLGAKWSPWKTLLLYGNVLFQMNNVGLRSDPVPLVGISYKF